MKKILLVLPFVLIACGQSEEQKKEKDKKLWDSLTNISVQKIDSLQKTIK